MVLSNRFTQWYRPRPEQAGSQRGRSCEEQILVTRLLIDIARKSKQTLYVTFVDFQKAYDIVNRQLLFQRLDQAGCGTKFLNAIMASMQKSKGAIGQSSFEITSGVRQGGCTSCSLFTFFIDPIIDSVALDGPDGWLQNLHTLLLMDDTVIFSTSREKMISKLIHVKNCTDELRMIIHPNKSQYLTVNINDNTPISIDNLIIHPTSEYVYLGTPISNKECAKQVQSHISRKNGHIAKFNSFLMKNNDAPFSVKKVVWDSAINGSILYSCETWLTNDLLAAQRPYMNSLKQMLGVRQSTCNELVLIESGVNDVKARVKEKQLQFWKKLQTRSDFTGSYVDIVIQLALQSHSPMARHLHDIMNLAVKKPVFDLGNIK